MMEFKTHHVCIKVSNIERAKAFYESALGFVEKQVIHHTSEITSCFMVSSDGNLQIQLLNSPNCSAEHIGYGHLGMQVEDIHESYAFHEAMGVVSQPVVEQPHQYGYFIKDPDGYETELCQLR